FAEPEATIGILAIAGALKEAAPQPIVARDDIDSLAVAKSEAAAAGHVAAVAGLLEELARALPVVRQPNAVEAGAAGHLAGGHVPVGAPAWLPLTALPRLDDLGVVRRGAPRGRQRLGGGGDRRYQGRGRRHRQRRRRRGRRR